MIRTLSWIDPNHLMVHPEFQRKLDEKNPALKKAWSDRLCVPLVVGEVSGALYIVDGQHRHVGALRAGDVPVLPVDVRYGLAIGDLAALVLDLNGERKGFTPLTVFRLELADGRPTAVGVQAALNARGLTLGADGLNSVEGLKTIFEEDPASMNLALDTIKAAWRVGHGKWEGKIIGGVAEFFQKNPTADYLRLARKMSRLLPVDVAAQSKTPYQGVSGKGRIALFLAEQYNIRIGAAERAA